MLSVHQARHSDRRRLRDPRTPPRRRPPRAVPPRSPPVASAGDELLLDACARVEQLVSRRSLDRLGQDTVGFRELAGFEERGPERGEQGKAGRGHRAGGVTRRVRAGCRRLPGLRARRPCARPPRAAQLPRRRVVVRARRPGRARRGSGTTARDGSRRSRPRCPSFDSSRLARRSCRSARTSFGTPSYAASWISTCVNLNASSTEEAEGFGWISCLRTNAIRCSPRVSTLALRAGARRPSST